LQDRIKFHLIEMENNDILFRYRWDFVEIPSADYNCASCENILREPMLIECCGNHFCLRCISDPLESGVSTYSCPDCKEDEVTAISDKRKWKTILSFQVRCPFSKRGCTWVGELGNRSAHISTSGNCGFAMTECKFGCGEELEKNQVSEHEEKRCLKRLVKCSFCDEIGEFQRIEIHEKECPKLPVSCPKDCGITKLKQEDLVDHHKQCPLEIASCDFDYAGCTQELLRRDLDAHYQTDSFAHLGMVTSFFASELHQQDLRLRKLVEENDARLKQLSESYENELSKKDQIIEELTIDREQQVLARLKDKEKEIDQALERLIEKFESKYAELKQNLSSLDYIPDETSIDVENERLELISILHRSKHNVEIWKGKYNGAEVAIKRPLPGSSPAEILLEAHTLRKLKNKHIVGMLAAITTGEPVSIVLEYVSKGTLEKYIKENSPLLLHSQINFGKQVALGLLYLQTKLCIHRRIRIDNVLMAEKGICKISDFSSAVFLQNHEEEYMAAKGLKLRIKWCAPEVLKQKRFCIKSDVWAYGVLLWQILANGNEPYPSLTTTQAQEYICNGSHMLRPGICSEQFYTIMLDCWKMDPWNRPTFESLLDQLEHVKDSHKYTQIDL